MYLKSLNCLLLIVRLFSVCFSKVERKMALVASSTSPGTILTGGPPSSCPSRKLMWISSEGFPLEEVSGVCPEKWQPVIFSAGSVFKRTDSSIKNSGPQEIWQGRLSVFQIPSELCLAFSLGDSYNFGGCPSASMQTIQNHDSPRKLCFLRELI